MNLVKIQRMSRIYCWIRQQKNVEINVVVTLSESNET
jgi:hypothetical protein